MTFSRPKEYPVTLLCTTKIRPTDGSKNGSRRGPTLRTSTPKEGEGDPTSGTAEDPFKGLSS